jgi:hypothetical protein
MRFGMAAIINTLWAAMDASTCTATASVIPLVAFLSPAPVPRSNRLQPVGVAAENVC